MSQETDKSAYINQENSMYLPYGKLRFFYGEYCFVCEQRNELGLRASEATFRRAFKEAYNYLKNEKAIVLKFNGGKGMFDILYLFYLGSVFILFVFYSNICRIF